jgi:DNA-binding transcriptional LysR family regulator
MDATRYDWTLLRSFLAVVDAGSLLGAARRLGTHQPTLSRQVAELESQLGLPLFERTGRGLVPTAAGRGIVDAAREVADAAAKVRLAVDGTRLQAQGSVRLSCSQVLATHLMPKVLVALRRQHPAIHIDLAASNAVSNLLRREADMALRLVRPSQSSLLARKLGDLAMGAYASSAYLKRRPAPTRAADLLKHELVGLDTNEVLVQALQAAGVAVTREHFALRCDDQVVGIELVRQGGGIGFLPRCVAQGMAGLVPVLERLQAPRLPVWLVVHREIQGSATVRAVFDALAEQLPGRLDGL